MAYDGAFPLPCALLAVLAEQQVGRHLLLYRKALYAVFEEWHKPPLFYERLELFL